MIEDLPDLNTTNCQKYHTSNPLVRCVITSFLDEVLGSIESLAPSSVADLGCGEGIVARFLADRIPDLNYLGIDTSVRSIEAARSFNPDLRFRVSDLFDGPPEGERAELAMCLEVLEHLPDPDRGVTGVLEWTNRYALVSVPWEPYFRLGNLLRGRYLRSWGDHPGHLQHFTPKALRRLLERHADVRRIWTSFPWILGLIQR